MRMEAIKEPNECVEPAAGHAFRFILESLAGGGSRWRSAL